MKNIFYKSHKFHIQLTTFSTKIIWLDKAKKVWKNKIKTIKNNL